MEKYVFQGEVSYSYLLSFIQLLQPKKMSCSKIPDQVPFQFFTDLQIIQVQKSKSLFWFFFSIICSFVIMDGEISTPESKKLLFYHNNKKKDSLLMEILFLRICMDRNKFWI